jgi:hypothetical protein
MAYQREKDVIPFVGSDEEVDIVLFITDGESEPKKINVRRCIDGDQFFTGNATGYGPNTKEMKDFLRACSRVPLTPIEFSFDTEVDFSGNPIESSFEGTNGFQFCYQLVYKDGFVSAISPFSNVAYPTAVTAMGINSLSSLDIQNVCNLVIPENNDLFGPSEEVRRIRLMFREGNEGVLKLIDELSLEVEQAEPNWDLSARTYAFRNNEVYGILPNEVLNKNFDHLPKKAKTQTVSDDRLMYGGYTEGFNNVITSTNTTVIFNERVTRLIGSEIELEMTTLLGDESRGAVIDGQGDTAGFKKQINSGFKLDFSEMPDFAEAGIYDIRVNVRPKQNFHIFNSQSFYGLGFGYFDGSGGTKWPSGIINGDNYATGGYGGGAQSPKSDDITGDASLVGNGALPTAGNPDHGIFNSPVKWAPPGGVSDIDESWTGGTSPTNPLIVKGGLVSFRVAFEIKGNMSKNLFVQLVDILIRNGEYIDQEIPGLSVEDVDIFFSPGGADGAVFDMFVDLGLKSGDSFDADDELADLVSHFVSADGVSPNIVNISGIANQHGGFANYPLAYFIVNRAKYKLRLEPLGRVGGALPSAGNNPVFNNGNYSSDASANLFYRFQLEEFTFPSSGDFNGNPFAGETPLYDGSYYGISNPGLFGNLLCCMPMPKEGFGVQTVVAINDDGKEHIGFPYQGPSYLEDPSGNDFYTDQEWKKGLIYFKGFADGIDANWPGITEGSEEDYYTDHNNWSYYSVPLMPFGIGRVTTTGPGAGNPEYRWPVMKTVSGTNVPNSNIAHPSLDGLGVKVSDTQYADFKNYDTATSADINTFGRIQGGDGPAPIGKWFVYDNQGLGAEDWQDDFSFSADVSLKRCTDHNGWLSNVLTGEDKKYSGPINFRPSHPRWWLPFPFDTGVDYVDGYSAKWLSKIVGFSLMEKNTYTGAYAFSVVDGASGPGGGFLQPYSDEVAPTYNPGDQIGGEANGEALPVANRRGSVRNTTLIGVCDNMPFIGANRKYTMSTDDDFNVDNLRAGSFEDVGTIVSVVNESTDIEGSFKSNDIHNFGIVYYDEKGRASSVYRLNNVYVPGYSPSERSATEKGSVDIEIELLHNMPAWAKRYQIVYGGSSNTRRFLQFFAGGAFTEVGAVGTQDDKIYVSLNYLQGSKISYTKAFGAKDQNTGEPLLYRYSEGDKLRIISSFTDDETVEYHPSNYVFDVIGVEEISELQDVNPLLSDDEDYNEVLRRTGSFLVLRNNIQAIGFDAQKVSLGTSRWGDRALVEVVTPKKSQDEDRVPYFETGALGLKSGDVGTPGPHVPEKVTVTSGDVFFRVVPNNTREYIAGQFVDLIEAAETRDEDASKSRFRGYYMESSSVSDLFRSQAKNYGRIHYVDEQSTENFNEASILYGEKNLAETSRPKITSFPSRANFLDLPKKYGGLDYLYDTGANIIAFQETKISDIQVNKSITTVASGGENLALSRNVLNDPRYYGPDLGSSKRPESITVVDNEIYFVDKDKKTLGLVASGGIKTLSGGSMSRFFDNFFDDVSFSGTSFKAKFSTGYNPRTNEFIISKYAIAPVGLDGLSPLFAFGTIAPEGEPPVAYGYTEGDVFYGMNDENPYNKRNTWPHSPTTLSYSLKSDSWKTFYSFRSNRYEYVDTTFVSVFNNGTDENFVWKHNQDGPRNNFYGQEYASYFNSFVNDNPSTTHVYTGLAVEGSNPWKLVLSTENELTQVTNFVKKEGTFYSDIPRTELQGGSSHVKAIGSAESIEDISTDSNVSRVKIVFSKNVDGYTFNTGNLTTLFAAKDGSLLPFGEASFVPSQNLFYPTWSIESVSGKEVVVVSLFSATALAVDWDLMREAMEGRSLFVRSMPRFYGDPLRDKYLKIEAIKAPSDDELISINIEATPSNLDSSM